MGFECEKCVDVLAINVEHLELESVGTEQRGVITPKLQKYPYLKKYEHRSGHGQGSDWKRNLRLLLASIALPALCLGSCVYWVTTAFHLKTFQRQRNDQNRDTSEHVNDLDIHLNTSTIAARYDRHNRTPPKTEVDEWQ